jgi:hypothetical protein
MIKPLKAKIDWDYMREATFSSDFALLYETACCCVSAHSNSGTIDFPNPSKAFSVVNLSVAVGISTRTADGFQAYTNEDP